MRTKHILLAFSALALWLMVPDGVALAFDSDGQCEGPCPEPPTVYYSLPPSVLAHINNDNFGPHYPPDEENWTFEIKVGWNPLYPGGQERPWSEWDMHPDDIRDFANLVFPEVEPTDPKDSPAHFIANYWGIDEFDEEYGRIGFANTQGPPTEHFLIQIYHATGGDSHGGGSTMTLLHHTGLTPERMAYDGFAHEFQHCAFDYVRNEAGYLFGLTSYPPVYNTCWTHTDGTTEFFSKSAEWVFTDAHTQEDVPAEVDHSHDLRFEIGIGRDDYYERCLLGRARNDLWKGAIRYQTYGLFSAYVQSHFSLDVDDFSTHAIFNWRKHDYESSDVWHRVDMWALADELSKALYQDLFTAQTGAARLQELYNEYALSIWCNSTALLEEASRWAGGKSPQDEYGIFQDWDEWCGDDIQTRPLYSSVGEMDHEYVVGPVLSDEDLDEYYGYDYCYDDSWRRQLHVDSYSYLPIPIVAGPIFDTHGECTTLQVMLDFLDTYTCLMPNPCSEEIDDNFEDWPHEEEILDTELSGTEVLHIWVLGYRNYAEDLDLHGDDAEILDELTFSGFSAVDQIGDDGTVTMSIPCFGTEYVAVTLVLSMTEAAPSEQTAVASILPFRYRYEATALATANITADTEWRGCSCLNNSITLSNSSTLTVLPGAVVEAKSKPVGTKPKITIENGCALVVGAEGQSDVLMRLNPDGATSWAGISLRKGAQLSLASTELRGFEAIGVAYSLGGGPMLVSIADCRLVVDPSMLGMGGLKGIILPGDGDLEVEDTVVENSQHFVTLDEATLKSLSLNMNGGFQGFALKVTGDATVEGLGVFNATNGVQLEGGTGSVVALGNSETSVPAGIVQGKAGGSGGGSVGVDIKNGVQVNTYGAEVTLFDRGVVVNGDATLSLRNSSFTDLSYVGVLVQQYVEGVDLGQQGSAGDNCIESAYERVYNDASAGVNARGNWWGGYPPQPGWFHGVVDYASPQTECTSGLQGGGQFVVIGGGEGDQAEEPRIDQSVVLAAYPNPSAGGEKIVLEMRGAKQLFSADIVDVSGRLVRALSGAREVEPIQRITWDGRDGDGRAASAGVYFAVVNTDRGQRAARIVVAR